MNLEEPLFEDFLAKINCQNLLNYVRLCKKLFCDHVSNEDKVYIVKQLLSYLQKPPRGHNLALRGQLNRMKLLKHCEELESINDLSIQLFQESYNCVYNKLIDKYSVFEQIKNK